MNSRPPNPGAYVFVVKLAVAAGAPPLQLAGRLQHVQSGRRHDFDSGAALLACLQHEQAQVSQADGEAWSEGG